MELEVSKRVEGFLIRGDDEVFQSLLVLLV
jgi:hypothetical protein